MNNNANKEGEHSEMARRLLNVFGKRRCNVAECAAYLERPEQSELNAEVEVLVVHGDVGPAALEKVKGFCRATGSDVIKRADCGVGDERFLTWADKYLAEGSDGYSL